MSQISQSSKVNMRNAKLGVELDTSQLKSPQVSANFDELRPTRHTAKLGLDLCSANRYHQAND